MAKEGVGIDINNGDINWEEFRIQNPELNEFEKIAQRELIKYIQLDWRHDITKKLDIYDKADNINIEAIFPCPEIISILDKKSQSLIALNWKDDYKRLKDFYG